MFILPPLPYDHNALEPYISHKTIEFHYGKHHQAYIDNLNALVSKTELEKLSLNEIIRKTCNDPAKTAIFNNAAQAFNHEFYWKSMKKHGGGTPSGKLLEQINKDFGSYANFIQEFKTAGAKLFGSGWVWLTWAGTLKIVSTSNAETPLTATPLLTMDVWEHAYYLDYQNDRKKYIENFLNHLVNWEFAQENFKANAKNS
jgi:Superoxide dismutase